MSFHHTLGGPISNQPVNTAPVAPEGGGKAKRVLWMLLVPVVLLAIGVGIAYFVDAKRDPKPVANISGAGLIRVNALDSAAESQSLNFDDLANLERVLADLDIDSATVTPRFALPHGVIDGQGEIVRIIGIDADAAELVGLDAMKDNVAYSVGGKSENVAVEVRVITEMTDEVITSDRGEKLHLDREPGVDKALLETLAGDAPGDTWVVSLPTFWKFAETTFDTDQADIIKKANSDDLGFVQLIDEVLISVQNAEDLETVQKAVKEAGYKMEEISVTIGD